MNERREPLVEDKPKHKKKSQSKGTPRSKHKHLYETVLLGRIHHSNFGSTAFFAPTKVCSICGRVGGLDESPSYYTSELVPQNPWVTYEKKLSDKAYSLPLWRTNDYKTAIKVED